MEKELTRQEQEEIFLKVYAETNIQKEAAEAVGWDKSKAWRFIKKIREKEPERLNAAMEKVRTNTVQVTTTSVKEKQEPTVINAKVIESPKQEPQNNEIRLKHTQPKENTLKEKRIENKANTKPQKGTMGFRANVSKIEYWRIYADVTDKELSVMCTAAIDEYIQRHELTADQQAIIDIRIQALEAERRIRNKIDDTKY